MTLWLLTTEYPPFSGGGISTYCYHTAQMMLSKGHQVKVFIPTGEVSKKEKIAEHEGVELVYFSVDPAHRDVLGYETALSYSLSEVLKKYANKDGLPDYIEAQEYNGIAYYPLQRRLLEEDYLPNVVFFVTAHAPGFLYLEYNQAPSYQLPKYWIGEMEKSVLQSADMVISPSQYLIDQIDGFIDWESQNRHVVYNPYRTSSSCAENHTPNDIVFFGKLTPQKGCIELLQYFALLWDAGFEHPLRLIGGGEHYFYPKLMDLGKHLREKYSKYIAEGKLIFEGHIEPEHIEERLSRAHVILIPSLVDNLPYTVLEAMSLGKVVLASKNGGHSEVIEHEKSGFLFEHDFEGISFRNQLEKILLLDQKSIAAVGKEAQLRVQQMCGYDKAYEAKISLLTQYDNTIKRKSFPFIRPLKKTILSSQDSYEPGLLSIVIPFYNMGQYVMDTIDSVLKVDYPQVEIIVINDGSTDKASIEVLESLKSNKNVKIVSKANEGLSRTRNLGIEVARGEFLAFLDSDDTVAPNYYAKAIAVLSQYNNVSFVGCWAQYFGESNVIWPSFNPEPPYLLVHNMVNSSGLIYKRADLLALGSINDPDMVYGMEDYEGVINLVKHGCHGVVLPSALWNYRIRRASMAQAFNKFSKEYLYRLIAQKHSAFYSQYGAEVANLLNANGPGMKIESPTKPVRGWAVPFENSNLARFIKGNGFLRNIAKKLFRKIAG